RFKPEFSTRYRFSRSSLTKQNHLFAKVFWGLHCFASILRDLRLPGFFFFLGESLSRALL
ncbi:unnamed protein product, partial [Brassica rapa subsp. trilocularis]